MTLTVGFCSGRSCSLGWRDRPVLRCRNSWWCVASLVPSSRRPSCDRIRTHFRKLLEVDTLASSTAETQVRVCTINTETFRVSRAQYLCKFLACDGRRRGDANVLIVITGAKPFIGSNHIFIYGVIQFGPNTVL